MDKGQTPVSTGKSEQRQQTAKCLGVHIDGVGDRLLPPGEFLCKLIAMTVYTLRHPNVTQKWLLILLERWTRAMCFRRQSFGICRLVWRPAAYGLFLRPIGRLRLSYALCVPMLTHHPDTH